MNKHLALTEVVEAMQALSTAVKALNDVYEKHPQLNDIQPKSMENNIPCSMDDWLIRISGCIDDWKAIPVPKMKWSEFERFLTDNGFRKTHTGGGLWSWVRKLKNADEIIVHDGFGNLPVEDKQFTVGVYLPGGDERGLPISCLWTYDADTALAYIKERI